MRFASITRTTSETDVRVTLAIDGTGKGEISTGCGFLDHMLTLFARHSRFDLNIQCNGDTYVDYHHTTEDIAIALGETFAAAMGNCAGIQRFASLLLPMDEALMLCAVDISGRSYCNCQLSLPTEKVGDFDTELACEFFNAFVRKAGITLHIKQLEGANSHHIIECAFKALARCLKEACAIEPGFENQIPSTKGVLL